MLACDIGGILLAALLGSFSSSYSLSQAHSGMGLRRSGSLANKNGDGALSVLNEVRRFVTHELRC